jgi:hypothetical protein
LYPFNIDAALVERGRVWDIGALEFIALYKVCYAVGVQTGDVSTSSEGNLNYDINNVDGRSIITFSTGQINSEFGIGNEVIDTGTPFSKGCLIFEKIDESNWYVTDYEGDVIADRSNKVVNTIKRPFNYLADCLDNNTGIFAYALYTNTAGFMASQEVNVCVACYNDSAIGVDNLPINDLTLTSDADYFLRIFTPNNVETEVNMSQKHAGIEGTGYALHANRYLSQVSVLNGIYLNEGDYTEVEGLEIKTYDGLTVRAAIESNGNAKNLFISKNILFECSGGGIKIDSYETIDPITPRDVIVNNLVYKCQGDAISVGNNVDEIVCNALIFNNTVVENGGRGIYVRKISDEGETKTTLFAEVINNIVQDSGYYDYVIDNYLQSPTDLKNNISKDASAKEYGGTGNRKNEMITFADRPSNNFNLSGSDSVAVDGGFDLSTNDLYAFDIDIDERERPPEEWDIGAFEISPVDAIGDFLIGPVSMDTIFAIASDTPPILSLYLREEGPIGSEEANFLSYIENQYQFTSIEGVDPEFNLNQWISDHTEYDLYHLVIYIHGGKSFPGTFQLKDRGNKTVTIKTLPIEAEDGPGSLIYDGNIIDDVSAQSILTFDGLKVYSDDALNSDYLVGSSSAASIIRFENSIVQVNEDAISDGVLGITVESVNSTIIYRNTSSSANLFLTKNVLPEANLLANSSILSFLNGALDFNTNNGLSDDLVANSLGFNYGSGQIIFSNSPSKVILPKLNQNPQYIEVEYDSLTFVPSELMANAFLPKKSTPLFGAGDNLYVSDIPIDIIGNKRIFDFGVVDIGHYELEVFSRLFTSEDIANVFQDKLKIDYKEKTYNPTFDDTVYRDLYYQFVDNQNSREEFVRESKIIIELKPNSNEFRVFSDKKNKEFHVFEAYYDKSSMSIIITKDSDLFNNLFSTIFDDGRYVFFFNEVNHTITVFENNTFGKGLSGVRNVVNKVKFGGQGIINN